MQCFFELLDDWYCTYDCNYELCRTYFRPSCFGHLYLYTGSEKEINHIDVFDKEPELQGKFKQIWVYSDQTCFGHACHNRQKSHIVHKEKIGPKNRLCSCGFKHISTLVFVIVL